MKLISKIFGTYSEREIKKLAPAVNKIFELEAVMSEMSDEELSSQTKVFKERLSRGETLDDLLPEAFAVVREASDRILKMKHYRVQVIGGMVIHQGRIAEMKTGEGKTLMSTLAAYLNALSTKVHIVTVNEYLAERDKETMEELYEFLGLKVSCITSNMNTCQRKEAYKCDIIYATNNELGFDYLRDNLAKTPQSVVQGPLDFCIVDEIDSVLIDEARTPLIISSPSDKPSELCFLADEFAKNATFKKEDVDKKVDKFDRTYVVEDVDFVINEKDKTATLTEQGVDKAEKMFNVDNLTDLENMPILHHINQALRANSLMKKDKDYVVKDGEILIIDEFTGRLMEGRRYNEGLHQAIEAKEGVEVQPESKTVATITFQNYFRMYKKLSGMTGTAKTEEAEFREIYNVDVIEIPTNKPVAREDLDDIVFKTNAMKLRKVVEEVKERHSKGQPVLIGTSYIETSELIGMLLKREKIEHEILNAKHHQQEAEIISQAGRFGRVTVATNMAGRGTDISLGGNPHDIVVSKLRKKYSEVDIDTALALTEEEIEKARELEAEEQARIAQQAGDEKIEFETRLVDYKSFTGGSVAKSTSLSIDELVELKKEYDDMYKDIYPETQEDKRKVLDVGGLHIIGTQRHESRRIDNQLRGRAGRQGDPGSSQYFLSFDDELIRLFGGERMKSVIDKLNIPDDEPMQLSILTNSIESAQKKLEHNNFGIRKQVIQYDNVINSQRTVIYEERRRVLDGEDLKEHIESMIAGYVDNLVNLHTQGGIYPEEWGLEELEETINNNIAVDNIKIGAVNSKIELASTIEEQLLAIYEKKEKALGVEKIRAFERIILLEILDSLWEEHLANLDFLKQGIGLRAYAQENPLIAYQKEGFELFENMLDMLKERVVEAVFRLRLPDEESNSVKVEVGKADSENKVD